MSKRDKRLEKLRQNPKNVSLDDLRTVLEAHGFLLDRIAGSHFIFRAAQLGRIWRLSIPKSMPIKSIYVKQALEAIDQILTLQEENDDERDD